LFGVLFNKLSTDEDKKTVWKNNQNSEEAIAFFAKSCPEYFDNVMINEEDDKKFKEIN
jgi:glycyl-tRNA synthetase beta subunit